MKLTINNYDWEIKVVPKEEIENNLGTTYFADLTIKIRKEQELDVFEDSLFHEITHAYMFSYGFDKNSYSNEEVVCFMTQNFMNIELLTKQALRELEKEKNLCQKVF